MLTGPRIQNLIPKKINIGEEEFQKFGRMTQKLGKQGTFLCVNLLPVT